MDRPPEQNAPRTAGQRNGSSGNSDPNVRDWQRSTWYGPVPQNSNPFDEPEDAPELKEIRSENVNDHAGAFWSAPGEGYQPTGPVPKANTNRKEKTSGKVKKRSGRRILAGTVLFLLALVLILRFAVFTVREIQITGNSSIPADEIIRISGIHKGDSILSLNEKSVEDRIVSDYRLQFRYLERQFPSRVILSVREREPCCWLTYCGIMYVMDKNLMVLYESENPADRPVNLVEVKVNEIRSNTIVGQYINLGSESQQSLFTELFLEMKVLGCTEMIEEADITNPDSILLMTRNGYTAGLGGRENLHAKLKSLLLVQDELYQMGKLGGTINVINPETPIYTP